jgi:hypothetical protein
MREESREDKEYEPRRVRPFILPKNRSFNSTFRVSLSAGHPLVIHTARDRDRSLLLRKSLIVEYTVWGGRALLGQGGLWYWATHIY